MSQKKCKCGGLGKCEVCKDTIHHETYFGLWLRDYKTNFKKNVNIQDIDHIIYSYDENWYITLEEKTNNNQEYKRGQREMQSILSQIFTSASNTLIDTMRGKKKLEYRGHYVIVFQYHDPTDSNWVQINGQVYLGMDMLFQLLKEGNLDDF